MLKGSERFNLPEIEEKVLEFWKKNKIFEKSLDRDKKKSFVFYEGPPTANGRPGTHHVLARVFKDIVLRYKTMQGFYISRRAGWDTQGLPVEIEVEKELGLKNRQAIEDYGIDKFNKKAKESVWKYKDEWERLTERIGFWLDFDQAYVTYDNKYLESLWWIFQEVDKKGYLKKFYKVIPFCMRCQTSLSSHEMGQSGVYKLTKDPSVYIKFKVKGVKNEYLLAWTTTPWTLPANVAIAVHPDLTYNKYKIGKDYLWSINEPPEVDSEVVDKVKGKELVGKQYEALYKNKGPHKVVAAKFVSAEDGTGLVHMAPAFGEEDLNIMKEEMEESDIPVTVSEDGIMKKGLPGAGKFIKEADEDIKEDLQKRGLLHHQTTLEHEYPFCWRCSQPLIYLARQSWFFEMSRLRKELRKNNKQVNWVPEHIKEGRFGNWIKEAKDWAISRDRYWGTPLPIWECQKCDHYQVIGGLDDLNKHSVNQNNFWLVRHPEATHNEEGWISSGKRADKKSNLTDKGIKEANKLAKFFKTKKIDAIYASPYQRTKQVAEIISEVIGVPIIYNDQLVELNSGIFNGDTIENYHKFFDSPLDHFSETPSKGENLNDVKKRMMSFFNEVNKKNNDKNILIVGHGDPLWMLQAGLEGWSDEEALNRGSLENGGKVQVQANNWPFDDKGELDLHRPYIDNVALQCSKCDGKMKRVSEVADVWFDSGSMPFAQWHYPFENKELVDKGDQFPADYICEAMDQTRGWFYTLLAISTLLDKKLCYKNVISLGLILDKKGQKMSKSKGNVVDPWDLINKHGVDALRWYFFTVNQPGDVKKFDEQDVGKALRRSLMLLYNSYVFLETYNNKNHKSDGKENILDKWVRARLNDTIVKVTDHIESYQVVDAAKEIESFIDDLSRWYIRRSRKRPEALPILQETILVLNKLIAPFVPFFAEALHQSFRKKAKGVDLKLSIHLEDWPKPNKKLINKKLIDTMEEVRHLASLALAKRASASIKVRQPLASLIVKDLQVKDKELLSILADEINVKAIKKDNNLEEDVVLDTKITPALEKEGWVRDLVRSVQGLRQDAGLRPHDKINIFLSVPTPLQSAVESDKQFAVDINATDVHFKKSEKAEAGLSTKIGNQEIWLGLKKS